MRTLSLGSILLVALCLAQLAHAQTNRRRTPSPAPSLPAESLPVSVVLKDGQTLKGKFISANSKKLSIIVGSSSQEMNMSDIASLIFSESQTSSGANTDSASTSAARDAIKAVRKLDSATSAGVTRAEYGTRLIDAKAVVDDLLPRISEGDLKSEIDSAMREYVSAGDIWQLLYNINVDEIRNNRGAAGTIVDVPKWIVDKYNLKPDDPGGSEETSFGTVHHPPRYLTNSILSAVWRTAKTHLDRAAQLAP
jgi:hypothetical protein